MASALRLKRSLSKSVRQTQKNLRKYSKEVQGNFRDEINASVLNIRNGAIDRVRKDLGDLASTITPVFAEPTEDGELTAARVEVRSDHGAFVEFGTSRAGASTFRGKLPSGYSHGSSHKFPPVSAFEAWGPAHGITAGQAAAGVFKNQGIESKPFLFPAFEEEMPKLEERLQNIAPRKAK